MIKKGLFNPEMSLKPTNKNIKNPMTTFNNQKYSLIQIINSSYVKPENMIDYLKKLKLAEFYEEKFGQGKSSADAAKAVDLSLSTIT